MPIKDKVTVNSFSETAAFENFESQLNKEGIEGSNDTALAKDLNLLTFVKSQMLFVGPSTGDFAVLLGGCRGLLLPAHLQFVSRTSTR